MFKRFLILFLTAMFVLPGIGVNGQTPRKQETEQVLCEFQIQGHSFKSGKEVTSGEAVMSSVTLDQNGYVVVNPFSLSDEADDIKIIYNRQTKRYISLNITSKECFDVPVHSIVSFNANELLQRNALCKALKAAGIERKIGCSPLALESEMCLQIPSLFEDSEEPRIVKSVNGNEHVFHADEMEIARFKESDIVITPALMKNFGVYLAHNGRLHPTVRKSIVKSGKLPKTLSYEFLSFKSDDEETRFKLVSELKSTKVTRNSDWDLVPQKFRKTYRHLPDELAEIIRQTRTELAKQPSDIETRIQTENQIQVFQKEQKYVASVMQAFRYGEITGNDAAFGKLLRLTLDSTKSSPLLRKFSTLQMAQEDWAQLVKIAEQQDEKSSAVAEYLYADTAMAQHWDVDAHALLISAVSKDPLLSGAYLNLGRLYENELAAAAWACYDISREIAPAHANLHIIDNLMRDLEKDFPDFF